MKKIDESSDNALVRGCEKVLPAVPLLNRLAKSGFCLTFLRKDIFSLRYVDEIYK